MKIWTDEEVRKIYESASENETPFAEIVDASYKAVRDTFKAFNRNLTIIGDDRAEALVTAIAKYHLECVCAASERTA